MQFSAFVITGIALALVSASSAAECYGQGGSDRCASWDSLWQFREWFCTQEWTGGNSSKRYNSDNGFAAVFTHTGPFSSQQQCWDSTQDIINQCAGHKDGGTWTGSTVGVNINFCA